MGEGLTSPEDIKSIYNILLVVIVGLLLFKVIWLFRAKKGKAKITQKKSMKILRYTYYIYLAVMAVVAYMVFKMA